MRGLSFVSMLMIVVCAGTAFAAGINGRLGITGKAGALVPLHDDFISSTSHSEAGIAAGGGVILGLCSNLAAELDVTRLLKSDVKLSGSKAYEASLTDIALGLQYRFAADNRLVPFIGGGADFVRGELKHVSGTSYDLDWTVGGHINLGFDYFVTRGIALTVDARGLYTADGDVRRSGTRAGSYDPMSFIGTAGIRLFLPEHPFD
jgi:outer membrane protein